MVGMGLIELLILLKDMAGFPYFSNRVAHNITLLYIYLVDGNGVVTSKP
jgi:hypothetical protein